MFVDDKALQAAVNNYQQAVESCLEIINNYGIAAKIAGQVSNVHNLDYYSLYDGIKEAVSYKVNPIKTLGLLKSDEKKKIESVFRHEPLISLLSMQSKSMTQISVGLTQFDFEKFDKIIDELNMHNQFLKDNQGLARFFLKIGI